MELIATRTLPSRLWAYLQMMRPANIVTAWADILVGYAAAGLVLSSLSQPVADWVSLLWLLLATTGLYGGGVVFNDVFDADLDAQERPERPIPSGRASLTEGIALGTGLLLVGIVAALQVSLLSGILAGAIALAALLYDAFSKHNPVLGPVNMGLCRGGNWLLGMSAMPLMLPQHGLVVGVPLVYIAAITVMSRGEVTGGRRSTGLLALLLLAGVAIFLVGLAHLGDYHLWSMAPFGGVWLGLVLPAFARATHTPSAELIRTAVRTGVISLIALDAAIAAGFSHWIYGLCILALLPLSRLLAQPFSVT
jgi:4-hydroxybenzoate polyprenyltransferase